MQYSDVWVLKSYDNDLNESKGYNQDNYNGANLQQSTKQSKNSGDEVLQ